MSKLSSFLSPNSIAIIGASSNKEKLGWQILNNLKQSGFKGKVYPVNLKATSILGYKNYKKITSIKDKVDLALIVIPKEFVLKEVENCAVKGIKNIVIISTGFAESDKAGKNREEKLKKLIEKYDLNLLGPNCLGFINSLNKINLTFANYSLSSRQKESGISVISQSGAIGSAMLDWLKQKEIKLSNFLSLGNKAGINENDIFEFFSEDKKTNLTIAYLEEISEGKRFLEVVSKLSKKKPVVILKAGKTDMGKKAALSHTGSMAGSEKAVELALKRVGAIIVESLEELFNFIELWQISGEKVLQKKFNSELYIVSNAGGPGVITTDLVSKYNLKLGNLKKLNLTNPLDILGDASAVRYEKVLSKILKHKNIDNVLVILTPQSSTQVKETAQAIIKLQKKYTSKNIIPCFIGGEEIKKANQEFLKQGLINFAYPDKFLKPLAKLINYQEKRKTIKVYKHKTAQKNTIKIQGVWDYLEALNFLKQYDIEVAPTKRLETFEELKRITYPVSLKAVGPNLVHKTEKQAVYVNIKSFFQAEKAFKKLSKIIKKEDYIVYQPDLSGLEMILGFKRDENFGALLMIGWGGVYTEILKDFKLTLDDIDKTQVKKVIKSLKVYNLIKGYRGKSAKDLDKLADTLVKVAKIARENKNIKELDVNPLFLSSNKAVVSDVRILS